MLSNAISRVSPSGWDSVLGLLPNLRRIRHGGDKLHKLTNLLTADTPQEIYSRMVTFWPSGLPVGYDEDFKDKLDDKVWSSEYDFTERMMLADTLT